MDMRRYFLPLILVLLSAAGCSSSASLGQLDETSNSMKTPDSGKAEGSSDGSSPIPSTVECGQHGGTCEFDDGSALTDPCTGSARPIGPFSCGAKPDAGTYFCCLPKPPTPPNSQCVQNGGTCEFDDGSALTDPCTASGRPIGAFACGAVDAGQYFCCLPK